MRHLEIKINSPDSDTIHFSIPEKWEELTKNQVLYIATFWQAWQLMLKNNADMIKARASLFCALINQPNRQLKKILTYLSMVDYEKADLNLLDLTNFIFEKNDLTINHFPYFKTGLFQKLYGPNSKLTNISINEFSFLLNYYNLYNKTQNEEYLDNFIACMYRPLDSNYLSTGDKRIPFNPFLISNHANAIKKLSIPEKQALLLFFIGCLEFFAKSFPLVFERSSNENTNTNTTFLDIIIKISGGKFGNFDQTKNQNAFIVLKELNNMLADSKKK
jgi:hypothetical protein